MPIRLVPPREGRTPYYYGRGKHLSVKVNRSTGTGDKSLAKRVIKKWEQEIERGEFSQPGEPTFADAAIAYMRAGGEAYYIRKLLKHFGDLPLSKIDQAALDAAAISLYPNATPATRNRQVYTPISAMLRHAGVQIMLRRPAGAQGNQRTVWLWPEQAEAVFAEAGKIDKDFEALLIILCYTGLRLSEALRMTWNDVRLSESFSFVGKTKNGEPRPVFLPAVAVTALGNMESKEGWVFKFSKGGHIYSLLRLACFRAGVELPEGTAFHVCRHSYGAWMRRYGRVDTTGLVATGAWKSREAASRYEHAVVTEEARRAELLPTPNRKAVD